MQLKDLLKRPIWLSYGGICLAGSFWLGLPAQAQRSPDPDRESEARSRLEGTSAPPSTQPPLLLKPLALGEVSAASALGKKRKASTSDLAAGKSSSPSQSSEVQPPFSQSSFSVSHLVTGSIPFLSNIRPAETSPTDPATGVFIAEQSEAAIPPRSPFPEDQERVPASPEVLDGNIGESVLPTPSGEVLDTVNPEALVNPETSPTLEAEPLPNEAGPPVSTEVADPTDSLIPSGEAPIEAPIEAITGTPLEIPADPPTTQVTQELPEDVPTEPAEPDSDSLDSLRDDFQTVPLDETLTDPLLPSVSPPEGISPELSEPDGNLQEGSAPEEGEPSPPEAEGDPDLGILRLRQRELSLQQPPIRIPIFLQLNSSYLSNSNTQASEDPVDDQLFRATASLTATPILNRKTALFATVQGNLFRYNDLTFLDYNEIRLRAGIRRVLFSRTIGELGWTHRQLFFREDGDRFLSDHAVSASISRRDPTPLGPNTSLNSFYRVRANFADPRTSSRVTNSIGTTLSYQVTPQLRASVTGLGVLTSFTRQSRQDLYGQALASLTYSVGRKASLSLFAAVNQGGSSDSRVDFDNALIGVSLNTNFKLFEPQLR